MRRLGLVIFSCIAIVGAAPVLARADDDTSGAPAAYAKFVDGAQGQHGLFTLWRKHGHVYVEIAATQLGKDFVQSAAPQNGLGGWGLVAGEDMFAPTRLIQFTRAGNKIVITWPNTYFSAPHDTAQQRAVDRSFAPSVVAVAPIVALDETETKIVFDGAPFLDDVLGLTAVLKQSLGTRDPDQTYRLDPARTFFGPSKAFPQNVIIEADQTFAADNPQVVDTVPDPRSIQLRVIYNIAQPPDNNAYMPRLADDRVGYVSAPVFTFGDDRRKNRGVFYIIRWDMQPSDPTKRISPAKNPLVFWISNTVPVEYRPTVRDALLAWNKAFERIGISDAVQVREQPDDPNWDPDDIRYNVVRWETSATPAFGAEAQWIYDPRTGQEFHTGILIEADELRGGFTNWQYFVMPARGKTGKGIVSPMDPGYAMGREAEANFGRVALDLMGRPMNADTEAQFTKDLLTSTVLHESGHDMGFQHNFIGSEAYTAKELQSRAFTQRMGVATSVMEYAPLNVWPKGKGQGDYWQTVLGPYDYYAIKWGYARIPGTRTPTDELPTLGRWASVWSNPLYAFASDEDVSWGNAHAIDPRVNQDDLTNDTLGWCGSQLDLTHHLMQAVDQRWPKPGHSYTEARDAFGWVFLRYNRCAQMTEHFIGGEYISRAHRGDPGAGVPLQAVSRRDEQRAYAMLDRYVFSDQAWNFSPKLLNHMVYQEQSPVWGGTWAYNPDDRHDMPIVTLAENAQLAVLGEMFQPLMLQRLDDLAMKAPASSTMSLADLFDWTQRSVFGDLGSKPTASTEVRRNLQQMYTRTLVQLWLQPDPGEPYDAQSLARAKLVQLNSDVHAALARGGTDELTRAHLQNLAAIVSRALDTRNVIPPIPPQM